MKVGLKEALLTLWDQLGILGIWPEVTHIFPANQMRGTEPITVENSDLKEPWNSKKKKSLWNGPWKMLFAVKCQQEENTLSEPWYSHLFLVAFSEGQKHL